MTTAAKPRVPAVQFFIFARLRALFQTLLVPFLAIFTALVIGAILILLAGRDPIAAYNSLIEGSLLEPRGLVQSLLKTTPLILTGLAVGFAFKGGMFNIGAQGQLLMGSVGAAWAGYVLPRTFLGDMPDVFLFSLALVIGTFAGALWGAIPGALKAYTEAHEVITTIMLNFVATLFAQWMVSKGSADGRIPPGPLSDTDPLIAEARSKAVDEAARLPVVYEVPPNFQLNVGIFIAIAVALIIMLLINRTTFGFEIRMVGLNPSAARYAGINIKRITISTMAIAGGMAGLAGAIQTIGVNGYYTSSQSLGLGFDGITVSLLAANSPIGIIFAAFLFGVMDQGTTRIQTGAAVQPDLIIVVQALILMFIAAPQIIQYLYRVRVAGRDGQRLSTSWAKR